VRKPAVASEPAPPVSERIAVLEQIVAKGRRAEEGRVPYLPSG
jgi:hypothetical protein